MEVLYLGGSGGCPSLGLGQAWELAGGWEEEADGWASPGAEPGLPVPLPLGLLNPSACHPLSPTHTESLQTKGITQPQTYRYCMSATILGIADKR